MTISTRIAKYLKENGITQKTIAELVNVTPSTVNTWIKTDSDSIPSAYIMPICRLFGILPEELLEGIPRKEPETVIPEGYVLLNEMEQNMLGLFRELDWKGQAAVITAAVDIEQRKTAQGINASGESKSDVG